MNLLNLNLCFSTKCKDLYHFILGCYGTIDNLVKLMAKFNCNGPNIWCTNSMVYLINFSKLNCIVLVNLCVSVCLYICWKSTWRWDLYGIVYSKSNEMWPCWPGYPRECVTFSKSLYNIIRNRNLRSLSKICIFNQLLSMILLCSSEKH